MNSIVNSLVKGKKALWNFVFPNKVVGHNATLGGIGGQALKIKLESNKSYPHLDINAFLMWEDYSKFTPQEKALVQALLDELEPKAQ